MSEAISETRMHTKYRFFLSLLLILPTIVLIGLILFFGTETTTTTRLDVVNSLLAVFGVWIGAIIAFYFGSENMEVAQKGIRETVHACMHRS